MEWRSNTVRDGRCVGCRGPVGADGERYLFITDGYAGATGEGHLIYPVNVESPAGEYFCSYCATTGIRRVQLKLDADRKTLEKYVQEAEAADRGRLRKYIQEAEDRFADVEQRLSDTRREAKRGAP